jgi:hypothetical protein
MFANPTFHTIKQVGLNGQISLGKEYAGKQVQISKMSDGSLLIQTGQFIPDTERWLYTKDNLKGLDESIAWVESHPRRDNFDEIAARIEKNDE